MADVGLLETRIGILAGSSAWGAAHEAIEDFRQQCDDQRLARLKPRRELPIMDCGLPADLCEPLDRAGYLTVGEIMDLDGEREGLGRILSEGRVARLRNWLWG